MIARESMMPSAAVKMTPDSDLYPPVFQSELWSWPVHLGDAINIAGGKGQYDIWISRNVNGEWHPPENVEAVNTAETDGWLFISLDGNELWFTRTYNGSTAVYRSAKLKGEWQESELIVSQFAGETTLDNEGNLYFMHHFCNEAGEMVEADIYVAYEK